MTTPLRDRQLRAALARWRSDPVFFAKDMFNYDCWDKQAEILRALTGENKYISCRSGHKCGKTDAAAIAALWFVVCFPDASVVLTAPTGHQVQNVLWKAVRKLYARAEKLGKPLGGECFSTAYTGLRFSETRTLVGMSTDKPEALAGISAPNLLFIVDEASGVDESIFEAVFGNMAGDATVLLISNPTRTSGTFYDSHHSKRHLWNTIAMSSLDGPNFHGEAVKGLATPAWAARCAEDWGVASSLYSVRVKGEFPTTGDDNIISLDLVEKSVQRTQALLLTDPFASQRLEIGLDVARYGGDEIVWAPKRGLRVYPLEVARDMDGPGVCEHTGKLLQTWRLPGEQPKVKVDSIGAGASAYDALKHASQGMYTVVSEVVASRKADTAHYPNLRSQLWFGMREFLLAGGLLPDDDKLCGELVAPTFAIDSKGRFVVSSKDEMREVLKRSPDRADAVNIAIYNSTYQGCPDTMRALRARLGKRRL